MPRPLHFIVCLCIPLLLCTCVRAQEEAYASYGEEFSDDARPASELLANYDEAQLTDTVRTTLRGTVSEVCQKKGCWMTLPVDGADQPMLVRFKDYGFFVPKNISGREVVLHGKAYYQITPVDELRHYAKDAGEDLATIAAITEPRRELRFLAEGVRIL